RLFQRIIQPNALTIINNCPLKEESFVKYLGIMLMASVLFMTGCQQNKNTLPTEKADDRSIQVEDSHPNKQKDKTNREMATHLANIAANVPNVNDAVSEIGRASCRERVEITVREVK